MPAESVRRDLARNGEHLAAFLHREVRRDQGAAPLAGLDHDRRDREPGDDPVARREPPRRRLDSRCVFGRRQAAFRDPLRERAVRRRIVAVDAAAEDGDRDPARLESARVRHARRSHARGRSRRRVPPPRAPDRAVARPRRRSRCMRGRRRPRPPAARARLASRRRAGTGPAAGRGSRAAAAGTQSTNGPRSGARAPRARPERLLVEPRGERRQPARAWRLGREHALPRGRSPALQLARRAVRQRLGHVLRQDGLGGCERRDRSRDPRHPRPAASREREALDGAVEQHVGLACPPERRPGQALSRLRHPGPHRRRRLARAPAASSSARGRGTATTRSKRSSSARESLSRIRGEALRRARASAAGSPRPPQGHRFIVANELEARRKQRPPADARDADEAVLERLPQRLERGPLELRQLVEQEDAAVREARLARAAVRARRRRSRPSRRCGAARGTAARETTGRSAASSPATEWIRVTSSASSSASGGRIPGRRRASIVFPVPGGPARSRLWPPAAASSSARRARSCPRTSARSGATGAGAGASSPSGSPRRQLDLAREVPGRLREMAHGHRLDTRERDLRRRLRCAEHARRDPSAARPPPTASAPPTGRRRPSSESSPRDACSASRSDDTCRGGGQDRERDREIEAGPLLAQARRSEVDRDAAAGPVPLGRGDPAAHALLRLLARTVGEPDDRERPARCRWRWASTSTLRGVEADEGVGDRAREHLPDGTAAIRARFVPSSCRKRVMDNPIWITSSATRSSSCESASTFARARICSSTAPSSTRRSPARSRRPGIAAARATSTSTTRTSPSARPGSRTRPRRARLHAAVARRTHHARR